MFFLGSWPDAGPPSPSAGCSSQERLHVVHQSAQDQGHLPHAESVQSGRDLSLSGGRVLVSHAGSGQDTARFETGNR